MRTKEVIKKLVLMRTKEVIKKLGVIESNSNFYTGLIKKCICT